MTTLLNKKQVAELLQVSQRTVERLRAKGLLPAVAVGGVKHKWYRWRQETVDNFIAGDVEQPKVVLPKVRRAVKPKQTIPNTKRFDWSKFYDN